MLCFVVLVSGAAPVLLFFPLVFFPLLPVLLLLSASFFSVLVPFVFKA